MRFLYIYKKRWLAQKSPYTHIMRHQSNVSPCLQSCLYLSYETLVDLFRFCTYVFQLGRSQYFSKQNNCHTSAVKLDHIVRLLRHADLCRCKSKHISWVYYVMCNKMFVANVIWCISVSERTFISHNGRVRCALTTNENSTCVQSCNNDNVKHKMCPIVLLPNSGDWVQYHHSALMIIMWSTTVQSTYHTNMCLCLPDFIKPMSKFSYVTYVVLANLKKLI